MSPVEIIAYKYGKGSDQFADIDVLEGTEEQLIQLRKRLIDNWQQIASEPITIVYQGTDRKVAEEAIKGFPRVSEEVDI